MRELKFRIWDKAKKCFPIDGQIYLIDAIKGYRKNLIAEQYTGLKDRNGKEIYEGDIVQIPDDWDEYGIAAGQRYEVYFAYGGFRCKPWGGCKRRGDKGYWIEDSEDFEVIGNVHENPELLQKYNELDK